MKPIIGVVARPYITNNNRNALCILETIRTIILKAGGIPVVILPTQDMIYINNREPALTNQDMEILDTQINLCDGILMPGGDMIYPYDKYICKKANEKKLPLLGICMGMQVMCNYNNENRNVKIEGHKEPTLDYVHEVEILKDSKLYSIIQKENIKVNSLHNYKVPNSGNYTIAAKCGDVIEAIEKRDDLFNIGVQWHPEILNDDISLNLFKEFVKAANIYMQNKQE